MFRKEPIEPSQLRNKVAGVSPGKAAALMHVDLFTRQPLHPAGKSVSATYARQRAELIAHERPDTPPLRQPRIIVRLAVMCVKAHSRALEQCIIQIRRHLASGIIL